MPTLIISDTHLGRPDGARSADALRPLWLGCRRLIVNGDVAEVHHPRHWAAASRQVLRLQDLCEADGVALTLLSGNHDPFLSDIRHLHLAGGRVFVTHGDVFHPALEPWSPDAGRLRRAVEEALAMLDPAERTGLEARLAAAQHASHLRWLEMRERAPRSALLGMLLRPWLIVPVLHHWRVFPRVAAAFAARHAPEATHVILGHTHRPGIHPIGGRVVINTGCFGFPPRPRAVSLEGDMLHVWRVRRRAGLYRRDATPLASYDLGRGAGAERAAPNTRPGSARPSAASTRRAASICASRSSPVR
jgi:UDP-2,3-diacylglucosamine pyrophosphatase LpxH